MLKAGVLERNPVAYRIHRKLKNDFAFPFFASQGDSCNVAVGSTRYLLQGCE